MKHLTLTQALETGDLDSFITQEEVRGVGPVKRKELDAAIKKLATTPLRSKDRRSKEATSRKG
jgi:hypothetical protein